MPFIVEFKKVIPTGKKADHPDFLLSFRYNKKSAATFVAIFDTTTQSLKNVNIEKMIKGNAAFYHAHDFDNRKWNELTFSSKNDYKLCQLEFLFGLLNAQALNTRAFSFSATTFGKDHQVLKNDLNSLPFLADGTINIVITTAWQQFCINKTVNAEYPFQMCCSMQNRQTILNVLYEHLQKKKPVDATATDATEEINALSRTFDAVRVHNNQASAMPILNFPSGTAAYFTLFEDDDDAASSTAQISKLALTSDSSDALATWRLYGNAHYIYAQFPQLSISANTLASAQGSATHFNFTLALTKQVLQKEPATGNSQTSRRSQRLQEPTDLEELFDKYQSNLYIGGEVDFDTLVDLSYNINPLVASMAHALCKEYFKAENVQFVGSDLPCMLPFFQQNDSVFASFADAVHIDSRSGEEQLLVTELKTRWAESLRFTDDPEKQETLSVANATHSGNLQQTLMQAVACDFWYSANVEITTQLLTAYVPYKIEVPEVYCQHKPIAYAHDAGQKLYANMMIRTLHAISNKLKTASKMPTHYTDAYMSVTSDSYAFLCVLILLLKTLKHNIYKTGASLSLKHFKIQPTILNSDHKTIKFVPQICMNTTAAATIEDYSDLNDAVATVFTDANMCTPEDLQNMAVIDATKTSISIVFVEDVEIKATAKARRFTPYEAGSRHKFEFQSQSKNMKTTWQRANALKLSKDLPTCAIMIRSSDNTLYFYENEATTTEIEHLQGSQLFTDDSTFDIFFGGSCCGAAPLCNTEHTDFDARLAQSSDAIDEYIEDMKALEDDKKAKAKEKTKAASKKQREKEEVKKNKKKEAKFCDILKSKHGFQYKAHTQKFTKTSTEYWVYYAYPIDPELQEVAFVDSLFLQESEEDDSEIYASPDTVQVKYVVVNSSFFSGNPEPKSEFEKKPYTEEEKEDLVNNNGSLFEEKMRTCTFKEFTKTMNQYDTKVEYTTQAQKKLDALFATLQSKTKSGGKWQFRLPSYEKQGQKYTLFLYADAAFVDTDPVAYRLWFFVKEGVTGLYTFKQDVYTQKTMATQTALLMI